MRRAFCQTALKIAVIALCVSGLGARQASRAMKPVVVTDPDDGRTVHIVVGQILDVRLASNPTTGYRWQAAQTDVVCVRALGQPTYLAPVDGALGAGGTQVFRYRAVRSGTAPLRFHYRRSWEPARSTPM